MGDEVKIGFLVRDAVSSLARKAYGPCVDSAQLEAMWVEVTSVVSDGPQCVYRGELCNAARLIDPAALRLGSPVTFTADHVYPAVGRR